MTTDLRPSVLWTLRLAVPVLAIAVAARQFVLQHTEDLSIWEGGGMGMFAAIGGFSRSVQGYVVAPDGARHPIVAYPEAAERLVDFTRKHPTEENLAALAEVLASEVWVAEAPAVPRPQLDADGQPMVTPGPPQYLLAPGLSPAGHPTAAVFDLAAPDVGLVLEYWSIRYDPATRVAAAELVRSFAAP